MGVVEFCRNHNSLSEIMIFNFGVMFLFIYLLDIVVINI